MLQKSLDPQSHSDCYRHQHVHGIITSRFILNLWNNFFQNLTFSQKGRERCILMRFWATFKYRSLDQVDVLYHDDVVKYDQTSNETGLNFILCTHNSPHSYPRVCHQVGRQVLWWTWNSSNQKKIWFSSTLRNVSVMEAFYSYLLTISSNIEEQSVIWASSPIVISITS